MGCVEPGRQRSDRIRQADAAQRCEQHAVLGRPVQAELEVLADRSVQQRVLLVDAGDAATQVIERPVPHVEAEHSHRAAGRVAEALDKRQARGLPAARGPDEGRQPPRRRGEGDAAQNLVVAVRPAASSARCRW